MRDIPFEDMVAQLKKDGQAIVDGMTAEKADLLHMAIGAQGEAGELGDAIKRYAIYNKPLDRVNVVEELGDLEFFLEGLRQRLGISREETLDANIDKLGVRYQGHRYSDEQAQNRRDKTGDRSTCEGLEKGA